MPGWTSSAPFSEFLVSHVFLFSPALFSFQSKSTRNMDSNSKGFISPMAGIGRLIDHPQRHGKVPASSWPCWLYFQWLTYPENIFHFIPRVLQALGLTFFISAFIGVGSGFVSLGISCFQRCYKTCLTPHGHQWYVLANGCLFPHSSAALNVFSHFFTSLALQRWEGMR